LTEEAKQELYDEVTLRSLHLVSPPDYKIFYELVVAQIQAIAFNQLAVVSPGRTYMATLKKELFVVIPHDRWGIRSMQGQIDAILHTLNAWAKKHGLPMNLSSTPVGAA
jgi:hypothetical protein